MGSGFRAETSSGLKLEALGLNEEEHEEDVGFDLSLLVPPMLNPFPLCASAIP